MVNYFFRIFLFTFLINSGSAQDTINFRQFDRLKTNAEDKYKSVNQLSYVDHSTINKEKDPDNFDVHLFRSINNSRSGFKDAVLPISDRSGPPMGFIMPVSVFVYGRMSKNYYDENTGYISGIAEILNIGATFGLKYAVNRRRPYVVLENVYHKEIDRIDRYSFPSGHTSITFSLAVMYNLRYPKYPQVYVPMYVYSLIVAYGRPYFGMHYPSDVLGGAIVGAGSAALIFSIRSHLFKFKNNILNENNEDTGSINGKNAYIFGGALILSSLIGQFVLHTEKVVLSLSPYGVNQELTNLNLRINF